MEAIDRDPKNLFPPFAQAVQKFLDAWNLNHPENQAQIFEALRTFPRQAELYAQGRGAPGHIVTNAPAGMSWHCYGFAVDIVFDADPVKPGVQWTWDGAQPWDKLGAMGQAMGLEWAGGWKSFREFPHFQKTNGLQLTEALELHRTGGLAAVWAAV